MLFYIIRINSNYGSLYYKLTFEEEGKNRKTKDVNFVANKRVTQGCKGFRWGRGAPIISTSDTVAIHNDPVFVLNSFPEKLPQPTIRHCYGFADDLQK